MDWFWSCNSNTLANSCEELTHLKRPWCWERLRAGGEGNNRGWDGWMASPTQWTWVWINSRSWWWTGRPGVLRVMGLQSPTQLSNWTKLNKCRALSYVHWEQKGRWNGRIKVYFLRQSIQSQNIIKTVRYGRQLLLTFKKCRWNIQQIFVGSYHYTKASLVAHWKDSACYVGATEDRGLIPWLGRSPGGGHGNRLQCSCLENPKDRGAWQTIIHRVAQSWTRVKWLKMHAEACTITGNTMLDMWHLGKKHSTQSCPRAQDGRHRVNQGWCISKSSSNFYHLHPNTRISLPSLPS